MVVENRLMNPAPKGGKMEVSVGQGWSGLQQVGEKRNITWKNHPFCFFLISTLDYR